MSGRAGNPHGAGTWCDQNRLPLVGARQPPHREFNVPVRQLTPAFDAAHIGLLGITDEKIARLCPRLVTWQRERLAQIAIVPLAPASHPVCEIARAQGHVATPTYDDCLNIGLAAAQTESLPRRGIESHTRH